MDRVISNPTDESCREGPRRGARADARSSRPRASRPERAGSKQRGRRMNHRTHASGDRAVGFVALALAPGAGARRGDRAPRQDQDEREDRPLLRRRLHDRDQRADDKLPKDKIRSISFQLPPARAGVLDAREDVRALAQGADRRSDGRAIDCYALVYQGMLASRWGWASRGRLKKMQKEIEGTKFPIKGSSDEGRHRHARRSCARRATRPTPARSPSSARTANGRCCRRSDAGPRPFRMNQRLA